MCVFAHRSIGEGTDEGYTVLTVRAIDDDAGVNSNITYSIENPSGETRIVVMSEECIYTVVFMMENC